MIVKNLFNHLYIFGSMFFMIYSQCVIKWRLSLAGPIPDDWFGKIFFMLNFLMTPWVISSLLATFISGCLWILALTRFELSYAYPWMSLIFILMLLMGIIFFNETLTLGKILGAIFVTIGLILTVRG